jgi:hypothetical protein
MRHKKKSVPQVRSAKETVQAATAPALHRLSRSAAQRLQKPHTGYEAFVEPLAKLVEQYAASIVTEGIDIELMRSALREVQQLATQRTPVAEHLALLDSAGLVAAATVWEQMLLIYNAARSAGRVNEAVEGAIDPFAQFMKTGPRKQVTPPATTTP